MAKTKTELLVIGAGPGGYAAAFYAADRGKKVVLVDKGDSLGGVCLNRGCIPSKALLHAAEVMHEANHANEMGITFSKPKLDIDKLRTWKDSVVSKLGGGIQSLAKKRNVTVIKGRALFDSNQSVRVETEKGQHHVEFEKAIIAVGSKPSLPPAFDLGNPRIMTSTGALELPDIPKKLLVVGGGYIGLEMGTVYASLGSKVTVVELSDRLLTGADKDLVRPIQKRLKTLFEDIRLNTSVQSMKTKSKQIEVLTEHAGKRQTELYDRVLVSVRRGANSYDMGFDNTDIKLSDKGFVEVNKHLQTNVDSIYAIGDIIGGVMLAHKASKEAKIAINHIFGETDSTEQMVIPAVVFTQPELAWCGLTEEDAKVKKINVKVAKFPWSASGRAMTVQQTDGLTKLIVDPESERVLGMGIVGPSAGDMIAEGCLAIEMGASAYDLAETIHPHPTLAETVMESAEVFYGHCVHS